jgi:hypothetical protein
MYSVGAIHYAKLYARLDKKRIDGIQGMEADSECS